MSEYTLTTENPDATEAFLSKLAKSPRVQKAWAKWQREQKSGKRKPFKVSKDITVVDDQWPEHDFWHADVIYTPTLEEHARIDLDRYLVSRGDAQPNGPPAFVEYRVGMASAHVVVETSMIDDTVEYQVAFYQYDTKGDFRIHHAHPCVGHHEFHHHNVYETFAEAEDVIRHFIAYEHHRNEERIRALVARNVAAEMAEIRERVAA